jgi:hypothetical protein
MGVVIRLLEERLNACLRCHIVAQIEPIEYAMTMPPIMPAAILKFRVENIRT